MMDERRGGMPAHTRRGWGQAGRGDHAIVETKPVLLRNHLAAHGGATGVGQSAKLVLCSRVADCVIGSWPRKACGAGNAERRRRRVLERANEETKLASSGLDQRTRNQKTKLSNQSIMNYNLSKNTVLSTILAAGACGHAAGTQPHEMSAAQHQAAATSEENQAAQHSAQHDPAAQEKQERCSSGKGRVCWTVTTNPTAGHQSTAEEHHALAAQHRAASKSLADAEARACTGLSDEDRDMSPFAHGADIRSVSQFREETVAAKSKTTRDAGATIVFRATPGLTAEWLQRIIECHLARNSAVGHDMPEMAYCPLVPRGAQATVRSVGDGFAVDVRADDAQTAAEIWRRAQQITPAR
jgi:hypothetical protein